VELAVCLPVLVILVLATIECTNMIFVQQSMHIVAYEGARVAIMPSATNAGVSTRCSQVVSERQLKQVSVTTTPSDIENVPPGETIRVRITAPYANNSVTGMGYFTNQLTADVVMVKE
jgi:Flp pilus assembly protein TadG